MIATTAGVSRIGTAAAFWGLTLGALGIWFGGSACSGDTEQAAAYDLAAEPPADDTADAWVDRLWERLGGREAFDRLRFLRFEFQVEQAGEVTTSRRWLWDRAGERVRLELKTVEGDLAILLDLKSGQGVVYVDGARAEDPAEEAETVRYAHDTMWKADSYWLVMPWKLRDEGVKLRLLADPVPVRDRPHRVLEVTFRPGTGATPRDVYHLFLDAETHELTRFAFKLQAMRKDQDMSVFDWGRWVEVEGVRFSTERTQPGMSQRILIRDLEAPDSVDEALFEGLSRG